MLKNNSFKLFRELPHEVRLLVIGTLINHMGGLIGPFLTIILVQKFGVEPVRAGWLVALFAAGNFLSILSGGWLTDRLGTRRTMIYSLYCGGLLAIALGCVTNPLFFYPLLFVFGFITDLFRPASTAALGDVLPSQQRSSGFAAMRVAMNLGGACAMIMGGLFLSWNWRALFILDGLTTLAFGAVISMTLAKASSAKSPRPAPGLLHELSSIIHPWLKDPVFQINASSGLIMATVFNTAFIILPLTITRNAGYSERALGLLMAVNGTLIVFFEIAIVKYLERFRRLRVVATGAALIALGLGLTGLFMHWAWFLITITLWTFGEILAFALLMSFHIDSAPPEKRGQYVALFQANFRIASAIGPIIFLPLYSSLPMWAFWLLVPLMMGAPIAMFLHLDKNYDKPEFLRGLTQT